MASKLVFTPEDFDAVITYDFLVDHLITIIQDIRQSDNLGSQIRNNIDKLEQLAANEKFEITKDTQNLMSLFNIYEQIKVVSMDIRKLLSPFINLNTYDSIGYVFYYNEQRFVTEDIKADWLIKGSKGSLSLDLEKAAQELSETYSDLAKQSLQDIFNQHYSNYLAAISGMYKLHSGYSLGAARKGARLNKGHVAEAYESHLAEHHSQSYNLLNNLSVASVADKAIIAHEVGELGANYWATHENPTSAWIHIRGALGTQRGTVAGDVGRFQVKQGSSSSKYSSQVRLSSVANLKRGVRDYCDIINPDIPVNDVARRVAVYLSERVGQPTKELQSYIANKEFEGDLLALEKKRIVHI